MKELPAQVCEEKVRGGIGDASTNCMGVMKYCDVAAHLRKLRSDPYPKANTAHFDKVHAALA